MRARGRSDSWLLELLELVQLGYIHQREHGWDAVADWGDVLSGGEKQRVAVSGAASRRCRHWSRTHGPGLVVSARENSVHMCK